MTTGRPSRGEGDLGERAEAAADRITACRSRTRFRACRSRNDDVVGPGVRRGAPPGGSRRRPSARFRAAVRGGRHLAARRSRREPRPARRRPTSSAAPRAPPLITDTCWPRPAIWKPTIARLRRTLSSAAGSPARTSRACSASGATIVNPDNFVLYTRLLAGGRGCHPRAAPRRRAAAPDVPTRRAAPRAGPRSRRRRATVVTNTLGRCSRSATSGRVPSARSAHVPGVRTREQDAGLGSSPTR